MKIRNKILFYFSSTVIALSALSITIIYIIFSAYREEEFQQQQFSKIKYTIGLIEEFDEISAEVSSLLDKQDIHDFYDEKMLVYDENKRLIFSSIDNLKIHKSQAILNQLSDKTTWIETKEKDYDLVGVVIIKNSKKYYAISKAYDYFGYSKKNFLRKVLISIFIAISIFVLLLSIYLSNIITKPITKLTAKISEYDLSKEQYTPLKIDSNTTELINLSKKFNELLKRTNDAFIFQKYSIQHISHELKTPITVLVSELEKIEKQKNINDIKEQIWFQIQRAKSLGNIINVLLQISKIEAGQEVNKSKIRIDEIVFDCIDEVNKVYTTAVFEIDFTPDSLEQEVTLMANESLIKQAFINLIINAVQYSDNKIIQIYFTSTPNYFKIDIINTGKTLSTEEQKLLFLRFFRGKNAQKHNGSGLGLSLAQKIFLIHNASIKYEAKKYNQNVFSIKFHINS